MNRRGQRCQARLEAESGEMPAAGPALEQHTISSSELRVQLLPESSVSHGPLRGAAAMGTAPGLPQARLQPANLRRATSLRPEPRRRAIGLQSADPRSSRQRGDAQRLMNRPIARQGRGHSRRSPRLVRSPK